MNSVIGTVDLSALKVNQISIITFTLLAYILNLPVLAAFVAIVLVAGTRWPELALFKQVYRQILKPLKVVAANPVEGSPAPHEFAQLLGGLFLGAGSVLLFTGSDFWGWVLAWVVVLLAAANLFLGFCAGCFIYYQLGKLGVPGFHTRTSK